MNLKDKMLQILENSDKNKHRVKAYFTMDYNSLGDSDETYIIPEGLEVQFLKKYIKDYEKYGEVSGFDGKGFKITFTDFELIDGNEI